MTLALWAISTLKEEESLSAFARRVVAGQTPPNVAWSVVLFSFLAFSRLGVWVFDLTTQQLTQTLVPTHQRSSFAGTENSIVNVFELLGAGAAIAFPRMEQYKWLALASLVSVVISLIMYAGWVRRQRGHLLHWEKVAHSICVGDRGR